MSKGASAISIIMALVLGFVVGNITGSKAPAEPGGEVAAEASANNANGPNMVDAERIPVGNSPSQGPANALVTIVEFSDFQCPFCTRVEDTLRQIRQQYGNDVRIVWKNAPLPFHNNATPAAEAAMEAFAQGGNAKFWQMHDLLYQNQQNLDTATLERLAGQVGLNMARFRTAMSSHAHTASVDRDKALAQAVGAQGTPNFFINGTQVTGAQPFDRFKTIIDQVLARARTIQPRNRVYANMVADPVAGEAPAPSNPTPPARPAEPDPAQVLRVPVGNSPVQGPNTALVTVVVFSDFQCPFCSRVNPTMDALRTRYGNDIRIVWKNEPLPFHDKARPAAELAMEAFAQRGNAGFWQMHGILFGNQTALDRPDLDRYAAQAQLNIPRYTAAMAAHTHIPSIDADHALAQQLEANGTPHFFVNGRRLVGAQPEDAFVRLIDETKTAALAFMASHPGTTRANLYERMMAAADTTIRRTGGGAAAAPTPAAPAEDENRVYVVRPNPNAPSFGPANARVVIEHFSDYQCPFCSRVGPQVAQIRQRYGDRVRFVWRDYPLPFHPNAMPAAEAAQEAFAQRGNAGFWRFHDHLFENQQHIERADLERYAQEQGLDMARFRAALDNHTHQARIRADMAAADASGAQIGTPAFFIAGKFVAGALPFEEFQRRIDAALAAPAAH
ncbi:MAG: Periplasmic thiol disulfide interchange protein DsbA [Myxococcaceae bacterium]|nr:Periplasmic thiol disulfide interchange protein DsbA [Myxococcaceae bacterium]